MFKLLNEQYGITNHGRATQYLYVQIDRSDSSYRLRQTQYIREVLERFGFVEPRKVGNPVDCTTRLLHEKLESSNEMVSFPYQAAVIALMYLTTSTRPDISFAVGLLSQNVNQPRSKHVGAVKQVFSIWDAH